tara:strand:- start:5792 stop:7900 length:2109 start_codon:yes stop_codon:yes gene_type:complete
LKTIQTILLFVSLLQAKPINGKIKNDGDVYLENVNIIALPSREGTQSDSAGSFALSTSQNDKFIIISHIGYISDTIEIASFNDELLITLKEKSIVLDSLEVESKIWGKTSYFSKKNMVTNLDLNNPTIRGSVDIGEALFSKFPVSINETMAGSKNISMRGSGSDELVFLYDGIRINNLSSGIMDLSLYTTLGLSNLEIISGSSDNSIYSSGAINLVPKIDYDNELIFSQKFGSYDFGSFDIYSSLGNNNVSFNTGLSNGNFSQRYDDDSESNEIQKEYNRISINTALRNNVGKELRLMGFRNEKRVSNGKTKDTINHYMRNLIVKFDDKNNFMGHFTLYGFLQEQIGSQLTISQTNKNNDELKGIGLSYETKFNSSIFKISAENNKIKSLWEIDDDNLDLNRSGTKITGSFEIFHPQKRDGLNLQDLKFVFSNEDIISSSESDSLVFFQNGDWTSRSSKFTISMIDKQSKKRKMIFLNLSNSYRIPSIYEVVYNEMYIPQSENVLLPEQKSMSELGVKLNDSDYNGARSMDVVFTAFRYNYTDKIKQLYIEDSFMQIPINYGDASIFGFDNYIKFNLNGGKIAVGAYLTNYFFSDEMAFQLKPTKMYRVTIQINSLFGIIKFIYRNENEKYLTTLNRTGAQNRTAISPMENFDIDISRKLPTKFADIAVSFSGKNLNNQTQKLMGISIYDRRYVLSLDLSIR